MVRTMRTCRDTIKAPCQILPDAGGNCCMIADSESRLFGSGNLVSHAGVSPRQQKSLVPRDVYLLQTDAVLERVI